MVRPSTVWCPVLLSCFLLACPHDRAKRSFTDGLEAHRAGKMDDAKAHYANALQTDANIVGVRINRAIMHIADGDIASAEKLLVEEHEKHGDDYEANAALALLWCSGPNAQQAQKLAQFVVDHEASAPAAAFHQAQLALALVARTMNDPYAIDLARKAHQAYPKASQTFVLGTVLAESQNCQEGASFLQQILDDSSYGPWARTNLAILRSNCGDIPGGLATALPLKDIAPKDPDAQGALGALLLQSGRFDEALAALENTVTLAPDRPGVRNTLAVAQYRAGRAESAKTTLRAELKLFPGHNDLPYRNLAWILVQETDFRGAIDLLSKGVEAFPENEILPKSLQLLQQFGDR